MAENTTTESTKADAAGNLTKKKRQKLASRAAQDLRAMMVRLSPEKLALVGHMLVEVALIAPKISPTALKRSAKIFLQLLTSYAAVPEDLRGIWVMGSARFPAASLEYQYVMMFCEILITGTFGFWKVVTGGGPGVMDAASQGAVKAGGEAIGYALNFKREQEPSRFAKYLYVFKNFATRKFRLLESATMLICFPGGFGTHDELWECLVLLQHEKTDSIPVYLVGSRVWVDTLRVILSGFLRAKTINVDDLKLFTVVDIHRAEIATEEQWVYVLPSGEKLPDIDEEPIFRIIGYRQALLEAIAEQNKVNPLFRNTDEQRNKIGTAIACIDEIDKPATW